MKSKIFAVIMVAGAMTLAVPMVASARNYGNPGRPAWAYQHPGWWQYYQNHHNPNHNRRWRGDGDSDDRVGMNRRYGDYGNAYCDRGDQRHRGRDHDDYRYGAYNQGPAYNQPLYNPYYSSGYGNGYGGQWGGALSRMMPPEMR